MDSRESNKIWDDIANDNPIEHARNLRTWAGGTIYAYSDSSGLPHLLIEVSGQPRKSNLEVIAPKGLAIALVTYEVFEQKRTMVDVSKEHDFALEPFIALSEFLIEELPDRAEGDLANQIKNQIEVWADFWKSRKEKFGDSKLIGLVGEVIAMSRWLEMEEGCHAIWQGPSGKQHDFQGTFASLEVKVSARRKGPLVHEISSIDQLHNSGSALYLLSIRIDWNPSGNYSLGQLLKDLKDKKCFSNYEGSKYLKDALNLLGWDQSGEYNDKRFNLLSEKLYEVTSEFPSITPEKYTFPAGVIDVSYGLDMESCHEYMISSTPAEINLNSESFSIK
jgi:hypothetical protein